MARINQSAPWVSAAKKTSGSYTGGPAKGLLHATIAPSDAMPGYSNQGTAPHQTLLWVPTQKVVKPFQHYYFDNFAKALANKPGGVETNRDTTLQFELGGYLGSSTPFGEFDILTAPNTYWEQVADIIGPVLVSWNVRNAIYPTSAGRMSLSQWDGFSGLCTHADAPENDHWDLPLSEAAVTILGKIWSEKALVVAPPPVHVPTTKSVTTPNAPVFPYAPTHYFGTTRPDPKCHSGRFSAKDRGYIRIMQKQLRIRGWKIDVDGLYGEKTANVVGQFQAEKRLGRDELTGPRTWRAFWQAPRT